MTPQNQQPDRTLVARYGEAIVSRTIGTIPALILRWQTNLGLNDAHVVLIATILSFYSTPPAWPSVSIESMMRWRGLPRSRIEGEIRELEAMDYLQLRGRDWKNRGSFFFDLSGLLKRLVPLVSVEERAAVLTKELRALRAEAVRELAAEPKANRGQTQRTNTK